MICFTSILGGASVLFSMVWLKGAPSYSEMVQGVNSFEEKKWVSFLEVAIEDHWQNWINLG